MIWRAGRNSIELGSKTLVMGILNVTPDSFSDAGKFFDEDDAVNRGRQMLADGADILDIGGESSRPGSAPVSEEEELRRVIPVIDRLKDEAGALISVDTTKSHVAIEAMDAGASIINDISAMRFDAGMAGVAARLGAGVVLMHMQGTPADMQKAPSYSDVLAEVAGFLVERGGAARAAGVHPESIVYDPGIGFGKTVQHNLQLLNRLDGLRDILKRPILSGPSRKSFIGAVLDIPVEERLMGTAGAVAMSIIRGASIIRVHDVREMVQVAKMVDAIRMAG
jgi:dihydropteroate synthase